MTCSSLHLRLSDTAGHELAFGLVITDYKQYKRARAYMSQNSLTYDYKDDYGLNLLIYWLALWVEEGLIGQQEDKINQAAKNSNPWFSRDPVTQSFKFGKFMSCSLSTTCYNNNNLIYY